MEKLILALINVVFPSGYGLMIIMNFDNIKGAILMFIAVLYGLARVLFYIIRQDHDRRMRNLDYEERKQKFKKKPE